MNKILGFATVAFFCTTLMFVSKSKDLKAHSNDLTNDNIKLDSLYKNQSERLLIYMLIDIEQNNVINKFQSSRMCKLRNKKLMDLQQKLN